MTVSYTFANQTGPLPLAELDANFAAVPNYANTAGIVTASAQPNITSVGTLTTVTSTGLISTTGNISGNYIIGNGSQLTGVLASGGTVDWANIANINNQYGPTSVAIGAFAGNTNQGNSAVAIGIQAGYNTQGNGAVAIGRFAGNNTQGANSVALGRNSGNLFQGTEAVAIGHSAGNNSQGYGAVAIGAYAGNNIQGANSVALGSYAGYPVVANNAIVINGSNTALNAPNSGLYIAPIINDTGNTANALYYNTSTNEITYAPAAASLASRTQVTIITPSLAANAAANIIVSGYKGYALYSIESNAGAWVTMYTSNAAAASDYARTINTDPTPGSGVIAEAVSNVAATTNFTPGVIGFNLESPPTTAIPVKVVNNDSVTGNISVTFTLLKTEQ